MADRFPGDAEVEKIARTIEEHLGPAATRLLGHYRLDISDHIRFMPLARRIREAREARRLSIKDVAVAIRGQQNRVASVEEVRLTAVTSDVVERLAAYFGLEDFLARWRAANPELAARVAPHKPARGGKTRRPSDFTTVLTLEIVLEDLEPRIWRRIDVPASFTFFDLHSAIIDAMGWQDAHLHEFRVGGDAASLRIGLPDDEFPEERPTQPGWTVPISRYLMPGVSVRYVYDFGDHWQHRVTCIGETSRVSGITYPRCIAGERACPPEDVGGTSGYVEFLQAVRDPHHESHQSSLVWAGGSWDAGRFDPARVRFFDPRRRLRHWLRG